VPRGSRKWTGFPIAASDSLRCSARPSAARATGVLGWMTVRRCVVEQVSGDRIEGRAQRVEPVPSAEVGDTFGTREWGQDAQCHLDRRRLGDAQRTIDKIQRGPLSLIAHLGRQFVLARRSPGKPGIVRSDIGFLSGLADGRRLSRLGRCASGRHGATGDRATRRSTVRHSLPPYPSAGRFAAADLPYAPLCGPWTRRAPT
jgi:hypothetical protein